MDTIDINNIAEDAAKKLDEIYYIMGAGSDYDLVKKGFVMALAMVCDTSTFNIEDSIRDI